jgi:uncharacterized protein (TIGR03083 family)
MLLEHDRPVDRCLALIQELSDALGVQLLALSPGALDGPSNCPPWRVRDLAAHVVSSGEGFVQNVRRGLAGSAEPSTNTEASQRRRLELEAASPVSRALADTTTEFIGLYKDLSEADLEAICFHRRGNRSVRWYATHRLAEIAFHSWDLQASTHQQPKLQEDVAALLLPTLLESNLPRTYAAGLSQERGRGERFLFAIADDPDGRWLITIDPESLTARRGDAQADLTIAGSASILALLAYGRQELPSLVQSGIVKVDGEAVLVDRFALIFPRP